MGGMNGRLWLESHHHQPIHLAQCCRVDDAIILSAKWMMKGYLIVDGEVV